MSMLLISLLAAAVGGELDPRRLPPELPPVPERAPAREPAAIFTYSVDGQCRVQDTRKLQGPPAVSWRDVQRQATIFEQDTVWRFVDGQRLQLRERRVKLRGELVRGGELVCHVRPAGDVVDAWIERGADSAGRRRPEREAVDVRDGAIEPLGTFSIDLPVPVS